MEPPSTTTPHVVIVPTPSMGHLIPLTELAKLLVRRHGFAITFVIPNDGSPSKAQRSLLDSLPPSITYVFLPPVSFDDQLTETTRIETIIALTMVRSLPFLRDEVRRLSESTRLVALVADLFGTVAFDVTRELSISLYIFCPTTAMCLSLFLQPTLDEAVSCEYRDLLEPMKIPGCIPVQAKDLLHPVQDRREDVYKWVLHHARRYRLAEGILLNSFEDLEPGAVEYLKREDPRKPLVYPVGPPVNMEESRKSDGMEWLNWLDQQPHDSVLYVSFGSGGTLSSDQIQELALGLEMSEQRFLWVVRTPDDKVTNATDFSVDAKNESIQFLPQGFLERTEGRGFLVPSWAPQARVLAHSSTAGFLTYCNWNSTLESVGNGVPLLVWPLLAEERMNALMLTQDIKVAVRLMANAATGLVGREEVARVVKGLIEGEEGKTIRNRMREDGSSTRAFSELALKWKANTLN